MPDYEVTSPGGKKFKVTAPPGATQDQVLSYAKQHFHEPEAAPSTFGDVATSFGRGVAKGAIGLAGLPGDVSRLVGAGVHAAGSALGLPEPPKGAEPAGLPPTSSQIKGGVEAVAGKFGTPQTMPGRYAESIGEFVPSAAIGPGRALTKAMTTIFGGVGAEAGGEIGAQVGHPEAGRFIGGLAGGAGAGTVSAEARSAQLSKLLPDEEAYTKAAKAGYKLIEDNRIQTDNASITALTTGLKADLENRLIDQADAPAVFKAVDNLTKGNGELAATMALFENMGKVPPSAGEKYAAAQIVREGILDWMEKLQPQDLVSNKVAVTGAKLIKEDIDPRLIEQGVTPAYSIEDANGNIIARARIKIDGDTATVENIYAVENPAFAGAAAGQTARQQANTLGSGVMRDALRQFKQQHPEVKKIVGERVSGASSETGYGFGEGRQAEVNVPQANDAAFVGTVWKEARGNWLAKKRLEVLREQVEQAETGAAVTGSGANKENKLRQGLNRILNSEKKSRNLTPEIKDKIREAAGGGVVRNMLRAVGKFAPTGAVSSLPTIGADIIGGAGAATGLAATGFAAKGLAEYLTRRQIREVEDLIKSLGPIGRPVAAQIAGQKPNRGAILPAAAIRAGTASDAQDYIDRNQ